MCLDLSSISRVAVVGLDLDRFTYLLRSCNGTSACVRVRASVFMKRNGCSRATTDLRDPERPQDKTFAKNSSCSHITTRPELWPTPEITYVLFVTYYYYPCLSVLLIALHLFGNALRRTAINYPQLLTYFTLSTYYNTTTIICGQRIYPILYTTIFNFDHNLHYYY